jgi:hypothetical protein
MDRAQDNETPNLMHCFNACGCHYDARRAIVVLCWLEIGNSTTDIVVDRWVRCLRWGRVRKVELLCIKLSIHFVREALRIAQYNNGAVSMGGVAGADNFRLNLVCPLL